MRNRAFSCFYIIAVIAIFWGCSSVPPEYSAVDVVSKLPEGMEMYASIEVYENRDVIKSYMQDAGVYSSDLDFIIDAADRMYAGADIFNGNGLFYGIFAGSFNTFLVNWGLDGSGDWEKITVDGNEWFRNGDLYVGFEGSDYFYFCNADPYRYPAFGGVAASVPPADTEYLDWEDVTAVLPLPSEAVMGKAHSVPVEKLSIHLKFDPADGFSLSGEFLTTSEKNARTLKVLIRFVIGKWLLNQESEDSFSERLKNLEVDYQGRYLYFSGIQVSREEGAAFLENLFNGDQENDADSEVKDEE